MGQIAAFNLTVKNLPDLTVPKLMQILTEHIHVPKHQFHPWIPPNGI
jgi:hypothetical protein